MTSIGFILLAGVAMAIALAFFLIPLIVTGGRRAAIKKRLAALDALEDELEPDDWLARRKALRRELETAAPDRPLGLIIALVLIIPAGAFLLYRSIGTPEGLEPLPTEQAEMRGMVHELAARARRNPEDVESWTTLGMIWKDLQQFPAAEAAFRRVARLEPDNPYVKVELAETLLFASGRPQLPAEGRALLAAALEVDPQNQKARWLLGISAYQQGDYRTALDHWQSLESILEDGPVREQVRQQIQRARMEMAHAGMDPGAAPVPDSAAPETPQPEPAAGEGLAIRVELSESLAGRVSGNETLFLFARAAEGPPMPLAVRRLRASDLPAEITLTDADGMAEGLRLSAFDQVIVTARITTTGDATPRAGDLQGQTGPIPSTATEPVTVIIDEQVP